MRSTRTSGQPATPSAAPAISTASTTWTRELATDAAARLRAGVDLTGAPTELMPRIPSGKRPAPRTPPPVRRRAAGARARRGAGRRDEGRAVTDRLVAAIASFAADRIAARHAEILAEARRLAALLHGFNQSFVASGPRLSPEVRADPDERPSLLARRADQGPWRAAADALRADPAAAVEIRKMPVVRLVRPPAAEPETAV